MDERRARPVSHVRRTTDRLTMSSPDDVLRTAQIAIGEWSDFSDRAVRVALTPAAVSAAAQLIGRWDLTVADLGQLLGGISTRSWHTWRRRAPSALTADQLTRVSLLLGIYSALHILHRGALADEWVHHPNRNPLFGGLTPLATMLDGGIPALLHIRALLDGQREGL